MLHDSSQNAISYIGSGTDIGCIEKAIDETIRKKGYALWFCVEITKFL